jgi:hypothetical protein
MSSLMATLVIIFICISILALLSSKESKGIGIAAFILFCMALIELGSQHTMPLLTSLIDGFNALHKVMVNS